MTDWLLYPQWNSTKKSGEKNMTCKFQPVSVEAEEEQRPAGEPSMQKTSGKGTKRKRPIEADKGKRSTSAYIPFPWV